MTGLVLCLNLFTACCHCPEKKGEAMKKLFVVGIGPGDRENMTIRAVMSLTEADLICGYTTYIHIVKDILSDDPAFSAKEYYETPMTKETERCRYALAAASAGRTAALVCSGDAGVYGMASPVLEAARDFPDVDIEIVPGVTAAMSGGALLGAPLGHDFAVISLSDRLTPWEIIEKRLKAAAAGDFCIALYNPRSHSRKDALEKAVEILKNAGLSAETPVGIANAVGREEPTIILSCLDGIPYEECGMVSTVFIGNSQTYLDGVQMITPRGYEG